MNKKKLTTLLVITHLLCILLGYCIAKIQCGPGDISEPTEVTAEASPIDTEKPTEAIDAPMEESVKEVVTTEETVGATEETEANAVPEETVPATQPPATQPPAPEPPTTVPPATEPPATEPPATVPPATQPPISNDDNWGSGEAGL